MPSTHYVNTTGDGGAYTTLQAAITAASDGDTIQIDAGTYVHTGTLGVAKSLTFVGAGMGQTVIKSADFPTGTETRTVNVTASNVTFQDLSFTGWVDPTTSATAGRGYLVWNTGDNNTYERVGFDADNIRVALYIGTSDGITITESAFTGDLYRYAIRGAGEHMEITDNIFQTSHYQAGPLYLEYGAPTSGEISGNVFEHSYGVSVLVSGAGATSFQGDGSFAYTITNWQPHTITEDGLAIKDNTFKFMNPDAVNENGFTPKASAIYNDFLLETGGPVAISGNIFENYAFVTPPLGLPEADAGGVSGDALAFDGLAGYGTFTLGEDIGDAGTVSFWVQLDPAQLGKRHQILEGPGDGGLEFQYRTNSGGQFYTTPNPAGGYQISTGGQNAVASSWTNLQYTWDISANSVKIYINGVETAYSTTMSSWTPLATADGTFYLGRDPGDSSRMLGGKLDELAIFSSALTPSELAEVRDNFAALNTTTDTSLVAAWNFDGATGNVVNSVGGTNVQIDLQSLRDGAEAPATIVINGGEDGVVIAGNSFDGEGTVLQADGKVSAPANWWNTLDEGQIQALIEGDVEFAPFLTSGTDADPLAPGFQNNVIFGDENDNDLAGTPSDDLIVALGGDDTITGNEGSDAIYGGTGSDAASYGGDRDDYAIVRNADGSYTVSDANSGDGDDGTDTLNDVEGVTFADGITYELDVNSPDFSAALERFSADFETDTSAFVAYGSALAVEPSGSNGVTTEDGASHLRVGTSDAGGAFTRFGGYGQGDTGFVTQVKIFLDTDMEDGDGFDWSVAANNQSGNHLRDFIFHVTKDDSGNIFIGADNNTNSAPQLNLDSKNHAEISDSGWYTFEHKFYENEDGALEVAMNVYDDAGNWIFTEVRSDPGDDFATDFGGSRYGWFTNVDVDGGIAVDSVSLKTLDENLVEVRDGNTVLGTFATIEEAKEAADNGDISGATLQISTLGQDDAFFYVVDGMSIQDAVDAASDGDTIEVAPGTYTESANYDPNTNTNSGTNPLGLLINKGVTIIGVDANGDPITDASQTTATVVSGVQSNWGTNFFVTAANVTIQGLRFEATAPGNVVNKAIEVVADGFTLKDSVVTAVGTKSLGSSVYINDNDTSPSTDPDTYVSEIGSYIIDGNILYNSVVVTNGTGWNFPGGATGVITGNTFRDTVNAVADDYRNWPLMITGRVDGVAWQNVPVAIPTDVSGNIFDGNMEVLLRLRDANTANLPDATFVEAFTETSTGSTYAYALTPEGELRYATDGQAAPTFYVMSTIGDLQTFFGDPLFLAGDTIVVDSGADAANETIELDALVIEAQAGSADLNLTLGADVFDITLADHAPGQGADVDVTGNSEDNVITGNSGDNTLSGGGGNDTLHGEAGEDVLYGGAGVDELSGGDDDDTLNGGQGNDILDGGDGNDTLNGDGNADRFLFSAGEDTVNGGSGTDTMVLFGSASDYHITIGPVPKSYTFERLSDGSITTASDIEIIQFQQEPPDAQDDALTVDTGDVRSLDVLDNDTPSGQLDVIAATLQSGDGTVSIGPGGNSISYDLTGAYESLGVGETATAVIDYLVSNPGGQVDVATATVTVNGVDDAVLAPEDVNGTANFVAENAAIGTLVGVTAQATDVDTNDTITYSIVNGDGTFAVNATTGVVTVAGALNAEDGLQQTVTVRATSTNGLGGTTTADTDFTVNIGDVDEFPVAAPVDTDGSPGGAILENATGAVGITALATDDDATTNAVTYSLSSNPGGHFAIDENSGVVTVVNAFDRESDGASVDITVEATSEDGSTAETVFTVAIGDANEFDVSAPVDTDGGPGGQITENAANGTSVGITAQASDADATNNTITYSLDDDDGGRFIISSTTGEVLVAGPIDREDIDGEERTIVVRATSSDGSFSTQSFTIAVDDIDEFDVSTPVDGDPASNNVAVSAAIGTYTGVMAAAVDADATNNGVTYAILGGTGEFSIDVDGSINVAAALNPAGGSTRLVTVQATSADGSTSQETFTINVTGSGLILTGTPGRDIISGSEQDDQIDGLAGNDLLYGLGGADTLVGGEGNDRLDGGTGDDTMSGGEGTDTYIVDSIGDVVIETGADGANDVVDSSVTIAALFANIEKLFLTGSDNIDGTGNELSNRIDGNSGNNTLRGEDGNDTVFGGDGADTLYGGEGTDRLTGDAGADILYGGLGKDTLTGGTGADKFVFDLAPSASDTDKISDFSQAEGDKIVLHSSAFPEIGPTLEADEFRLGTSANAATNRVIYDQSTGRLFYDADGNGSGASILVATLQNQAALALGDFEIVA